MPKYVVKVDMIVSKNIAIDTGEDTIENPAAYAKLLEVSTSCAIKHLQNDFIYKKLAGVTVLGQKKERTKDE